MKFKLASLALTLVTSLVAFSGLAAAQGGYVSGTVGNDLSWPNCNQRTQVNGVFGIIGVTDGLGYSTNPCLSKESSLFASLSLYANTGWDSSSSHVNATSPKVCSPSDQNCVAYNYGYNAGLYAYNAASSLGLHSPTWWLDVETANTWSSNQTQNQNSLQGEYDALINNGAVNVGIYSTTAQWNALTGTWHNGWPNWGASTWRTASQARTYCSGHQFTAGPTWLIQYLGKIDQDYAC